MNRILNKCIIIPQYMILESCFKTRQQFVISVSLTYILLDLSFFFHYCADIQWSSSDVVSKQLNNYITIRKLMSNCSSCKEDSILYPGEQNQLRNQERGNFVIILIFAAEKIGSFLLLFLFIFFRCTIVFVFLTPFFSCFLHLVLICVRFYILFKAGMCNLHATLDNQ